MQKKSVGLLTLLAVCLLASQALAGPMPGAIFTTLDDGSRVNHNIYDHRDDVYLDGGPGNQAPQGAAGLDDGVYYFQVTDPSGKVLLSEDPVECRAFEVSDGIIVAVMEAAVPVKFRGQTTLTSCAHAIGADQDHGALTVQLMPYSKTPNKGGVYKVWVTSIYQYVGSGQFHGFVPAWSKTDNYKVKGGKPCPPPMITVRKFDDSNANGLLDFGEVEIPGWPVSSTDPLGVINNNYTAWSFIAVPKGPWNIAEELVAGWLPTSPTNVLVNVDVDCDESYEVTFLNIELGDIEICKQYDLGADGVFDSVYVPGFRVCLEGTAVNGEVFIKECQMTGADGCAYWDDLLPGDYTASEMVPTGWYASNGTSQAVTLPEGGDEAVDFLNYCTGQMMMHTKGFWQNQGCDVVDQSDLDYLATLDPYDSGSAFTGGQDNCGGVACPPSVSLPLGSVNDLGCYIVASNSQSEVIGLGQQLMAFILNTRHYGTGNPGDVIVINGGSMAVGDVIDAAIAAWQSGVNVQYWQTLLDGLNNSGYVDYIAGEPCPIEY